MCYNITNISIIFEEYESEESFISYLINYEKINNDIKLDKDLKITKIISIILGLLNVFNLMLLLVVSFKCYFNCIYETNFFFLLMNLFIFYIISIILSSLLLNIVNRLYKSFS